MIEDSVIEMQNEKRYAPSINTNPDVGVDEDLAKELQKIPDKMAFKIGEVADLTTVKAYVLRYWETEFPTLKPDKSKHNQRVYLRRDVETVMMIKKLLYKDRFSIEGARAVIKDLRKETKKVSAIKNAVSYHEKLRDQIHDIIKGIQEIKSLSKKYNL